MAMTVLEECPDFRFAHLGSVYVTVWFNELTREGLDLLEKHHRALTGKYGKITVVSVVMGASKAPGAELRNQIKAQGAELAKARLGNIVVVQARGLAAIIARSFLAMLSLLSPETMKVPKSLEAAADEVRKLPGQDAATVANEGLADELIAFVALPRPK